ncbi:MAG: Uma2 family endonuclease [Bacteroidota bacterium]
MITDISLLDTNKTYTYANYLTWRFQERIELIKGKLFRMSPAPARRHQKASFELSRQLGNYLYKNKCDIYSAPFDVRFPNGKDNDQTFTVVQPDICVICDISKLDDKGCVGAPDLIIEILSPSTAEKDAKIKFQLYQEQGVKEYWMVYPDTHLVDVFILDKDGKYQFKGKYTQSDKVRVDLFKDLEIVLEDVFED